MDGNKDTKMDRHTQVRRHAIRMGRYQYQGVLLEVLLGAFHFFFLYFLLGVDDGVWEGDIQLVLALSCPPERSHQAVKAGS